MSFAACKTMHCPTGIENCASGFITHSAADITPQIQTADVDSDWPATKPIGPVPNLVVSAGNVLDVYLIRVEQASSRDAAEVVKRGGLMAGISAASLELVCTYRLHGNIYSMGVITAGGADGGKRRDSIILSFEDAKMSVLEFDDATHGLRTSSMHFFEGPDWFHLKSGRESFDKGPIIKVDPQGRCAGVFAFEQQMIVLKAAEVNSSLAGEDSAFSAGGASARIESSYIITLRDLDVRHVKDFTFLHGYIEPVMVILHERELTWSGRVSWKHHTCMVSAFSISTTLKQHPLIWSATNLPHDAYKLLAVPSPIGGVLVIGANTIHYHSQSSSCSLALNNFAFFGDNSQEMPRSSINVELDAANATWLTSDVAMLSTKTGELLLLTIIYDGRIVQKLDLSKSRASVLTSGITTIGDSLFFLGSRLGDSLLVQFSSGLGGSNLPPGVQEEVGDIESDAPSAKRLRMSSSDALQDMINGEELSLYGTAPNNAQSAQKTFSFAVRDSLINVGPLKDFSYGMRINADLNATGIAKQSNYELVCCSGHGKNGSLSVLQQSIRPETITQEALPGCKGIWTVYHKNTRIHLSESSRMADEEDEYHAYLIISLEARTMVLQTANNLEEVTENVDYYVQGTTLAAGNLFGRRRVIQVFAHGARILDGAFMTQELSFKASNVESGSSSDTSIVASVSIADPYVLLRMTNGSLQLLVGDPSSCSVSLTVPSVFESSKKSISACTLYHDKGPEPWLRKTSTDAWLSSGMGEAIDGADGVIQDQGDVYCVVCYENGTLEIFDVPSFTCVFSVDKFISGRTYLVDTFMQDSVNGLHAHSKNTEDVIRPGQKENSKDVKINVVELMMHRWIGKHSRPFLFGILNRIELAKLCSSKEWSKAIRILDSLLAETCVIQDICNRAFCYSQLELHKHVIKDCDKALQLDPKLLQAYIFKGRALSALGKKEEAILIWEQGYEHAVHQSADLKQLLELEELLKIAKQNTAVGSNNHSVQSSGPESNTGPPLSTKSGETCDISKASDRELKTCSSGMLESSEKSKNSSVLQNSSSNNAKKHKKIESESKELHERQANKTNNNCKKLGYPSLVCSELSDISEDSRKSSAVTSESSEQSEPNELQEILSQLNNKCDVRVELSDEGKRNKKFCVTRVNKTKSINVDFRLSRGIAQVHCLSCDITMKTGRISPSIDISC